VTDSNLPGPNESPDDTVTDDVATDTDNGWTGSAGDLPDLIELTPDLVEEEAIRGDFMLRWAAILLAVLLGCGQIATSRTLVHIRSGLDMQTSGILPSATDPYSHANAGNSADNVSWLLDHILAAVWTVGGATGLTVFKAILAGVIAWQLTRISMDGLPTWWNSICGVLALAACCSDLMPITDLMTLLGLVILLRLLHSAFLGNISGLAWKVPLTIAVWSNLDPRAWLGVFAILLFSIGRSFSGRSTEQTPVTPTGPLWRATALSAVALLINPFPVASIMSPIHTYFVEYPALRELFPLDNKANAILLDGRTEYYSLLKVEAWDGFEFAYIGALVVIALAVCALSIASDRQETPWALVLGGFIVLAVMTIHELAAAALVAAAVAGTVGQRWYQRTFPQEYTTKPSEVLFSRAGRAVTVFSFALVGFLIVTDRVPTRTPVGTGFTSDFQTTLNSLKNQFESLPEDASILHTRPELGDFLIWNNRQSYVDSRIRPFGVPDADGTPIRRYMELRKGVMAAAALESQAAAKATTESAEIADEENAETQQSEVTFDPDAIHAQLKEEGISHVIVRLSPPGPPDYRSMRVLGSAPDSWLLTDLASSAAIFTYLPNATESPEPYDARDTAFRQVTQQDMRRFEYAREPSFYEQHLYRSRAEVPEDLRIARHFASVTVTPSTAMTAIRAASRVLTEDSQNAGAYYALAMAYSQLGGWERQRATQSGGAYPSDLRYMQTVMAARQAVTANPELTQAWSLLGQVYGERGRIAQAVECLDRVIAATAASVSRGEPGTSAEQLDQMRGARNAMAGRLQAVRDQIDRASRESAPEDPTQRAVFMHQLAEHAAKSGDTTTALDMLRDNEESIKANAAQIFARAQMLKGQLLFESGALQEGSQVFVQLDSAAQQQDKSGSRILPWHTMSFYSLISRGLYNEATELMAGMLGTLRDSGSKQLETGHMLVRLPFVAQIETALAPELPVVMQWPLSQLAEQEPLMRQRPNAQAEPQFMLALTDMEAGNTEAAKVGFQSVIAECGQNPYRPLAATYLTLLDDDAESFLNDNFTNIWEDWDDVGFEPRLTTSETQNADTQSKIPTKTDSEEQPEPAKQPDAAAESTPPDDSQQ